MAGMRYRLALDLGSTSLGWAMLRLNADQPPAPIAVIKAGVRIFSDGRNPKDGSSLAVTRREARSMRRRRDRLLKRKNRMAKALIEHRFFPTDDAQRQALVTLNPYALRAKGLDEKLTPEQFARALFHINQRRGFKSNRKTDKKDNDSGALKQAISKLRTEMAAANCRTVGEWLHRRDHAGETVRARYRETKVLREDGKTKINKSYDLYIDRAMIEAEFDALWARQSSLNPQLFTNNARDDLKDILLHQRPLKPVKPGRCTLMPEEERAPLALPSTQRFRMYQEVNNLRILREGLKDEPLTLAQRDTLIAAMERKSKLTFAAIKTLLKTGGAAQFNFEDPKREELKGNTTSAILGDKKHFWEAWFAFEEVKQDAIVLQLVHEENEAKLVRWLQDETGIDEARAEAIANAGLPEGYGSLCANALAKILPELRRDVVSYAEAAKNAGFHHSRLSENAEVPGRTHPMERTDPTTGEIKTYHIFDGLPYYGEFMQRHVGFAKENPRNDEERFGKIANPTVHIGLNQVRVVVNALIKRYGHPSEVIVEVANELKRPKDHRPAEFRKGSITLQNYRPYCGCSGCTQVQQSLNQEINKELRRTAAEVLECSSEAVSGFVMQKLKLWHEMGGDVVTCPYSGTPMSVRMILSPEVEIDHILPHSRTLDDGRVNKTLCIREANRIKGEKTPYEARELFAERGWLYDDIQTRVRHWHHKKRFRFGEKAMEEWVGEHKGFLARALNDTRHLSKIAREYVSLICPQAARVIPGQMTAMLRGKFGLNDVLGLDGSKNRNDHRHHAVDACVIGITDQGMLQRFAWASASAREHQLNRLVENMPFPWGTDQGREYVNSVKRAIDSIWVSHKPDHGHEGAMFDATIYSAEGKSKSAAKDRAVIAFEARNDQPNASLRHMGKGDRPKPYKGLLSNSNYCIEIWRTEAKDWDSKVLRTFDAYQVVKEFPTIAEGVARLRNPSVAMGGQPLVMRLMIGDYIRATLDNGPTPTLLQVLKINSSGSVTFIKPNETNISARYTAKLAAQKAQKAREPLDELALKDDFFQKAFSATSLKDAKARRVTISPIGDLRDPGFAE